jgi:hypothetical protein
MTEQEFKVVETLADAWNQFLKLPVQHPDHNDEFRHVIHDAQRMIFARVGSREYQKLKGW